MSSNRDKEELVPGQDSVRVPPRILRRCIPDGLTHWVREDWRNLQGG